MFMDEADALQTEEEDVVTLEGKHRPVLEDSYHGVLSTTGETEEREDESGSAMRPLLQHQQQQHSRYENHKVDTQTPTDGADQRTSVPQELESDGADQPRCSGSVSSQCSSSSSSTGHECPICSERFDSRGDHRIALLNCDHTLCHHCLAGILRRAKDPSRVQCPFCRQNTPSPQWEIQRMQEEVYSNSVYEPGPGRASGPISPGPEPRAVTEPPSCCFALERQLEAHAHRNICGCCSYPSCLVRALRLMRHHSLCFSITALLLLFLMLMGCFLCMDVPFMSLSTMFSDEMI